MSSPESLERAREWLLEEFGQDVPGWVSDLAALLDSVRAEGFTAGARAQREAGAWTVIEAKEGEPCSRYGRRRPCCMAT